MTIKIEQLDATPKLFMAFVKAIEAVSDLGFVIRPDLTNEEMIEWCRDNINPGQAYATVSGDDVDFAIEFGVLPVGFGVGGTEDPDHVCEAGDELAAHFYDYSGFFHRWDGQAGTKVLVSADPDAFAAVGLLECESVSLEMSKMERAMRSEPPPAGAETLGFSTDRYVARLWQARGEWVYDVWDNEATFSLERGRSNDRETCVRAARNTLEYVQAGMDA